MQPLARLRAAMKITTCFERAVQSGSTKKNPRANSLEFACDEPSEASPFSSSGAEHLFGVRKSLQPQEL